MGFLHIRRIRVGIESALIISQLIPGRRNNIQSLCIGDQIIKGGVTFRLRNLMPGQAYRLIQRDVFIDRSHKAAHRSLTPAPAQPLMLHISDITIHGPHLIPLLHGLQHSHLRPLFNPGDDRTLDSALFPDISLAVRYSLRLF